MKKSTISPFSIIGAIFAVVGVVFLMVGIIVFAEKKNFMKNAQPISAVITDIQSHYERRANGKSNIEHETYVEYEIDGQKRESILGYYSSGMYVGQEIQVFYNPEHPNRIEVDTPFLPLIFTGMGGVFAVLGFAFLAVQIKKSALRKRLISDGEQLCGVITSIVMDTNIRINGRHPYRAECEVTDPFSGAKYLFRSDIIMKDISGMEGMSVTVYADRNDRSKYYVDIYAAAEQYNEENAIHDYR
ncbi:MAG: DUF3592 domain-containing protein [Oscillospiraceae bacterium]|nr:DUF3592 domain-containing protein [Oscillospiraceae bacterium]